MKTTRKLSVDNVRASKLWLRVMRVMAASQHESHTVIES